MERRRGELVRWQMTDISNNDNTSSISNNKKTSRVSNNDDCERRGSAGPWQCPTLRQQPTRQLTINHDTLSTRYSHCSKKCSAPMTILRNITTVFPAERM